MQLLIKSIFSGLLIALVSTLSKQSTLLAGILASLPVTSILALIWVYRDTQDIQSVSALSNSIFWMILPSLSFFIIFSVLLKQGGRFYVAMGIASVAMVLIYAGYSFLLNKWGIKL